MCVLKVLKWLVAIITIVAVGLLIALIVVLVTDNDETASNRLLAPTIRLNNGIEFPVLGLGTAGLISNEGREGVMDAIDRGYRLIDGAWRYSNNDIIGQAVNAKIAEGVIMREDMFISNKLWSVHHNPIHVRPALENTLTELNLTYIDLYLIHWPVSFIYSNDRDNPFPVDQQGNPLYQDIDILDTWRAMEELVDLNLTRAIGLSNFNTTQVDYIADNARIQPVVNQVEVNAHCLNKRLTEHHRSRNIVVTAYSPLGAPGREDVLPDERLVIREPEIRRIAMKHRKTPAQVLIRYQYQMGRVTVPKSINRDRIISNFDVFNFNLDDSDVAGIEGIGYQFRTRPVIRDVLHPSYPFHDNCV